MIGIYKITSPNNRIYIGQSVNIERRFNEYKKMYKSNIQIKLYRSFFKYGVDNHLFEIIEECNIENLNEKERYWQEYYNSITKGLNCYYTKTSIKPQIVSNKIKKQISNTLKEKYSSGEIINPRLNTGKLYNIHDYKGNIIYKNLNVNNIIKIIGLSNRSVINNTIRKNRYLSKKKYVIVPNDVNYINYIKQCIIINEGSTIPIYQVFKDEKVKKCTNSQIYRIKNKILKTDNLMYYSKKSKSYYTFSGLIIAVLDRNILDN